MICFLKNVLYGSSIILVGSLLDHTTIVIIVTTQDVLIYGFNAHLSTTEKETYFLCLWLSLNKVGTTVLN